MVPNFLIILSGFSFGHVITRVPVFKSQLSSHISSGFLHSQPILGHGGGLTLHETCQVSSRVEGFYD